MTKGSGSESKTEHSDAWRNFFEWSGVLTGPIAWAMNLQLTYAFVQWACVNKHMYPLRLANVFFIALTIVAGSVAFRISQKLKDEAKVTSPDDIARQRFMVNLGMLTSAMFALAIVAQGLATFFIKPCWD